MTHDMERQTKAPMRFAYQELATPSMVWLVAGIAFSLLAIVAALGPLDTRHTLTLIQRFAYFGVVALVMVPIGFASLLATLYIMRNRGPMHFTLALALTTLIVVAPGAAVVIVVYGLFHAGGSPQESFFALYGVGVLIFTIAVGFACYVLHLRLTRTSQRNSAARAGSDGSPSTLERSRDPTVPCAGTTTSDPNDAVRDSLPVAPAGAARSVAPAPPAESSRTEPRDSGVPTPQLRLPAEIGRDIVYAHVSGHYVEVVTTAGAAIVLMRLSDVARALEGEGMQTHRSYWAAYHHVVRLQINDHRLVLHLTAGHKVPVSRSFRSAVRAFMANRNNRRATLSAVD
jgi:hypothetical protein